MVPRINEAAQVFYKDNRDNSELPSSTVPLQDTFVVRLMKTAGNWYG